MPLVPLHSRTSNQPTAKDAPAWRATAAARSDGARSTALPHAALDDLTLGELLVALRSDVEAVREAAWAACYARYHRVVWTRAFYVMRSVAWLAEPREAAADVASDVFVGLPDAARHYREEGRAEWWLQQIAVRTALRKKESLTGVWATGKRTSAADARPVRATRGREYVSVASWDETSEEVAAFVNQTDGDELLELDRRRRALRESANPVERRWDEFLDLYVAGFDFREIGARMGLTEGTARNWLCKTRKHLALVPDVPARTTPPARVRALGTR